MTIKTEKGGATPTTTATATEENQAAIATTVDEAVSSLQVQEALTGLSPETIEKLSLELKEALHAITISIDDKVKASKILERDDQFMVIDAITLEDYVDKRTGEVSNKHIFVLEFPQGDVQVIMQSDAAPRARLVDLFVKARKLNARAITGPYKMAQKDVGQPQAALIFEKQAGFQARVIQ